MPSALQTSLIRSSSVATKSSDWSTTCKHCRHVLTIIGTPHNLTNGFPGSRDEAYRAGMTTICFTVSPWLARPLLDQTLLHSIDASLGHARHGRQDGNYCRGPWRCNGQGKQTVHALVPRIPGEIPIKARHQNPPRLTARRNRQRVCQHVRRGNQARSISELKYPWLHAESEVQKLLS